VVELVCILVASVSASSNSQHIHSEIFLLHNAYVFLDTLRVDGVRDVFLDDGFFCVCALLARFLAGGSSDLPTMIKSGM